MKLMPWGPFGASLMFAALLALTGCGEQYEWNQKLTVTIETPSGEVSGSSVTHVSAVGGGKRYGMDGPNSTSTLTGEATVVDLGGGRFLFAIFNSNGNTFSGIAKHMAEFAFCTSQQMSPGEACFKHLRDLPPGTATELKPDNYPMLVTFDDIKDPKTVRQVDPFNLATTFGDGYALKSMQLEITDEKLTEGKVEGVLGWIYNLPQPGLCPPTFKPISESPFCSLLGKREFIGEKL